MESTPEPAPAPSAGYPAQAEFGPEVNREIERERSRLESADRFRAFIAENDLVLARGMKDDEVMAAQDRYAVDRGSTIRATDPPRTPIGTPADLARGVYAGSVGSMGRGVAAGLGTAAELMGRAGAAEQFYQVGRDIREGFAQPDGPTRAQQVGEIVGSAVPAVAGLAASGGATAPVLAALGTQAFGGGVEDYRATLESRGQSPEAVDQLVAGVGSATIEVVSERLGLNLIGRLGGRAVSRVGDAIMRGNAKAAAQVLGAAAGITATSALEEAVAQAGQNTLARLHYDPQRGVADGVAQAAGIGAALGPVLGGAAMIGGLAQRPRNMDARREAPPGPEKPEIGDDAQLQMADAPAPPPSAIAVDSSSPYAEVRDEAKRLGVWASGPKNKTALLERIGVNKSRVEQSKSPVEQSEESPGAQLEPGTITPLGAGGNFAPVQSSEPPAVNPRSRPVLPTTQTVAQADADRPEQVGRDIRAIRRGSAAPKTYRQIMEGLSSALNLSAPGTKGNRRLGRSALGYYMPGTTAIRLDRSSNVSTHFHEVGHALHEMLFPEYQKSTLSGYQGPGRVSADKTFPEEWRKELAKLGKDLYGSRTPTGGYTHEGWAEFTRFLVTDPKRLKQSAPTVYRQAVGMMLQQHPEAYNALLRARAQLKQTQRDANPMAKIRRAGLKTIGFRSMADVADFVRFEATNTVARIQRFKKDIGLSQLPASKDPEIRAYRYKGLMSGHTEHLIHYGTWDLADPGKVTGPGIADILRPIRSELPQWEDYMVAKRAIEKRGQGYKVLPDLSDAELKRIADEGDRNPEYARAAEQFQKLNEWLIRNYAVHHGLISEESAEQIIAKNLHYITFRYQPDQAGASAPSARGGRGLANQSSGIRRFNPDGGDLVDPLAAFLNNMQSIVQRAQANAAARSLTNLSDRLVPGIGRWIDKIQAPAKPVRVRDDDVRRTVSKQLEPTLRNLEAAERDAIIDGIENLDVPTFFEDAVTADRKKMQFSVLVDGKRQFYEAKDRMLFEILDGISNPKILSAAERLAMLPAQVLRAGATGYNPTFFVPNFVRDAMSAAIATQAKTRNPLRLARNLAKGYSEAFKSGDVERLFLLSGADMSGILSDAVDPRSQRIDKDKLFGMRDRYTESLPGAMKAAAKDIATLRHVHEINRRIERMARFAEFESVREGRTDVDSLMTAGQAAADITLDFQRGGRSSKWLNQYIPFFNASILGTSKLARELRSRPVAMTLRIIGGLVAPSIAVMMLNFDDEDYWAKPKDQRDRFWFIPRGVNEHGRNEYIKIPKPYGWGIASILVERSFAGYLGINPATGARADDRATQGAFVSVLNQLRPDFALAGVSTLMELASNYDSFRDRPIVSHGDQTLPAEDQGAESASATARGIGAILGLSPAKIDHAIAGFTGGLGRDVTTMVVDPIVSATTGVQPGERRRAVDVESMMVLRGFMARATRHDHQAYDRFFSDFDAYFARHRRMSQLTGEELAGYVEKYRYELNQYRAFRAVKNDIDKIMRVRREVMASAREDPDAADRELERLHRIALEKIQGLYRNRAENGSADGSTR